MVYNWISFIHLHVFPISCLLCGSATRSEDAICPACLADMALNRYCCPRCSLPLPSAAAAVHECGDCQKHPPDFDRSFAPYLYQPPLDHLLTGFKFSDRLANGRLLAGLLSRAISAQQLEKPQLLIPAPLHDRRLRHRGFNQASELTAQLSQNLGIPWSPDLLSKTRYTGSQSQLNRKHRQRNVKNSFAFRTRPGLRHVALVDDVITTGSTAREMARSVKLAGVEEVEIWAVARTPAGNHR